MALPPEVTQSKVKKRKPPKLNPVKAPAGDIASSGGDYGTEEAKTYKKTPEYHKTVRAVYRAQTPQRKRELLNAAPVNRNKKALPLNARQAVEHNIITREHNRLVSTKREAGEQYAAARAGHDIITEDDMKQLDEWERRAEEGDKGFMGALLSGEVTQGVTQVAGKAASLGAKGVYTAMAPATVATLAGIDKVAGTKIKDTVLDTIGNAGREVVDLPLNTVPAAYRLGSVALPGGEKGGALGAAKMLGDPYVQLYKDPLGFAQKNPITTLLMVAPAYKVPRRVIGDPTRVQRLGTTGVESTQYGKGLRGKQRKVQGMAAREMDYRIDTNIAESWNRQINPKFNAIEEFADKAGSPHNRPWVGTKAQADKRAARLSSKKAQRSTEGSIGRPIGDVQGKWRAEKTGFEEDAPWAVVPEHVMNRLDEHAARFAGTPHAFTQFAKLFRQGVLLSSPKWIPGNVSEATLRSIISRSGLIDYTAGRRIQAGLQRLEDPSMGRIFESRTTSGGHSHLIGSDIEKIGNLTMVTGDKVLSRAGQAGAYLGDVVKGLGKVARNPHHPGEAGKGVAQAYNGFSKFVFESVNGGVEHQFQTAHMGQALRRNKLIPRGMAVKNKQLIDEWVKGASADKTKLRNLATDVGREIDRTYGRYSKMSPNERWYIGHFTPFYRWSANAVNFLYHIMPTDHPVLTAAVASMSKATEEYRKNVGQYYEKGQLASPQGEGSGTPTYLQGSIPGKGGSKLRLSHFFPMGIHEQGIGGAMAGVVLPFGHSILQNLEGKDWKGDKLANDGDAIRVLAALTSAFEQSVPFAKDGADLFHLKRPNQAKGAHPKLSAPFDYTKPGKKSSKTGGQLDFGGTSDHEWDFSTGGGGSQWDFGP